jgi:two-component system CheB/CheR fusion protein
VYERREDSLGARREAMHRFIPPVSALDVALPRTAGRTASPAKLPLRELTEQALLQQVAPAGALVNGGGDILYLHGRTGMVLEPASGEAGVNNILKMAREGMKRELATALRKAAGTGEVVRCPGLRVKTNGHFATINLTLRPVVQGPGPTAQAPLYLVIFEEAPPAEPGQPQGAAPHGTAGADGADADTDRLVASLKEDLKAKEDYLQNANEELETSNEELKSSNEEMQSVNEELQSTNEELETSKEELQSVNEELATVNAELQIKVADLSRANDDMHNLLAGTGIATVFVDHQLRILRFTPTAREIINLIPGDVGRPVGHITSNLSGYDLLVEDVRSVLDTLVPRELEVQAKEGRWFALRIMPYRTQSNVIEGAVITFIDITEMVRTREALREANEIVRLAVVVRDAHDAITVQDLEGRILAWNPGAVRMYGWTEAEALALNVRDRIPEGLRKDALARVVQLSQAAILEPYLTRRLTRDGRIGEVSMISTALVNDAGQMYAVATTERETKG